ncbi:MAG: hypothetical protein GOVbin1709_9 [Prokaryotic dsDNA virus sp.]|nr:MAG: hypothetical protein GOVbin1709_9 [Prokaryotic dsDNA virus sp.]|tara:strand:+ start:14503 stop:15783 length:1281 start_codon:yes stop_codon:yes gene_type:complete
MAIIYKFTNCIAPNTDIYPFFCGNSNGVMSINCTSPPTPIATMVAANAAWYNAVGSPVPGTVIQINGSAEFTYMGSATYTPGSLPNLTPWVSAINSVSTLTTGCTTNRPPPITTKHHKWMECDGPSTLFNVIEQGLVAYTAVLSNQWWVSVGSPASGEVVKITVDGNPKCLMYKGWDNIAQSSFDDLSSSSASIYSDCVDCEAIYGCTDPTATNYDPNATIDDGSCIYTGSVVRGCTDPSATVATYNPNATADCDGNVIGGSVYNSFSGGYGDTQCCVYPIAILGCTDPLSCNYNPNATVDDGSCCDLLGCMDPAATNYDPNACCDDGSCIYPPNPSISGCTDPTALNYNPLATADDGSCQYPCTPEIVDPNSDPTDPSTPNPCSILQLANQWSANVSIGTIDCSPTLMNDLIMIIALNDMLNEIV